MKKKKIEKKTNDNLFKTVSFETGAFVRKMTKLGKIVETQQFKDVVSGTEDLCKTVGSKTKSALVKVRKNFKKNIAVVHESFEEGMASVTEPVTERTATLPEKKAEHMPQQILPAVRRKGTKAKGMDKERIRPVTKNKKVVAEKKEKAVVIEPVAETSAAVAPVRAENAPLPPENKGEDAESKIIPAAPQGEEKATGESKEKSKGVTKKKKNKKSVVKTADV